MIIDLLPLAMFGLLALLLFSGYPVAFVLAGIALIFGFIGAGFGVFNLREFYLIELRIFGDVVDNLVLVAIPMFIFMGVMMEKSGVANNMLMSLQHLSRRIPGGLALAVTFLGVVMAATTGIIGASVVMLTVLALPVMLRQGYSPALSAGSIAASGTLGILIPPSIMLVVMGDLLSISVGALFMAAFFPGLLLAGLYMIYIFIHAALVPSAAPRSPPIIQAQRPSLFALMFSFLPPMGLMLAVLGSIFLGLTTPTEAAGIGAFGALLLAWANGRLNLVVLRDVVHRTALTGGMLFGIFVCATAFSYVFRSLGGETLILEATAQLGNGPWGILLIVMALVFVLGFFLDWIEITLIVLPVFAPIIQGLDFGHHVPEMVTLWFAVLIAVNLQTSFLTPPFGFALFYMKGASGASLRIQDIYLGIIPFVVLQLMMLGAILAWPELTLWLPRQAG